MVKVFVYGSLLSGMHNHVFLEGAKFIGVSKSPKGFAMTDLGYFPGVVETGEDTVLGEVYEVDGDILRRLDHLEGYRRDNPTHGLYTRKEIETAYGKAIIYLYNNPYGRTLRTVENGDWRTYCSKHK